MRLRAKLQGISVLEIASGNQLAFKEEQEFLECGDLSLAC